MFINNIIFLSFTILLIIIFFKYYYNEITSSILNIKKLCKPLRPLNFVYSIDRECMQCKNYNGALIRFMLHDLCYSVYVITIKNEVVLSV